MKAALFLVVSLLAVAAVSCKQISYQNCSSSTEGLAEIVSIDLTPCDEEPCVLNKGANETVTISFIPQEVVTDAKIYMYAIYGKVSVALPVPNPNACQDHGLTCPLKSGVQVEFVLAQYIPPGFPSGRLKVKFEIKDQDGKSLLCGIVPLEIE